jgi:hypothetical protein
MQKPPRTVAIPFVEGDRDGSLTQALIHAVTWRTPLLYRSNGAAYLLRVRLLDVEDENIGFRYDRTVKGRVRHSIVPAEVRLLAKAEVSLCDSCSGAEIIAPTVLEASIEFDHDYYSTRNAVNVFSLGQLTDIDAAREAASRPLYTALARTIADFLASTQCD